MYKNLKIPMLVEMLKRWRKPALRNMKYNEAHKMEAEYWKGQISIIDSLLQVIQIFK